ncbi:cytochrome P450 [Nocardia sp. NPDC060256]|uniref:cytochrome P450 n=1 Tax=unclassified Nocardia TaxID=2637762 RepID=UPI00364E11D5
MASPGSSNVLTRDRAQLIRTPWADAVVRQWFGQKILRTCRPVERRSIQQISSHGRSRLTRQMLNEVLRMWPIAPGFFRVARSDQNVGGYEIPAGRAVFVLSLAAQRDTDVWGPAASSFDPDRFDPAALRRYPERFFKPWGAGPRSCIGRVFAIHEATVLLARILDAFVLSTSDELRIRERAALSPEPVTLHLTPRP